ncbi:sigma-54-dependent transcriptional regulator [Microvirgula aerodenitrificans]|uniref:sigma-54-dependent transcriptional regulator n=1 Tax=Microvirgula aerodenitrificans TaxID=57480 RepID=UPI00248F0BCD|nr:sigma-54 dependent transcriptional regulator [Microvirgula aerodenitrificans]
MNATVSPDIHVVYVEDDAAVRRASTQAFVLADLQVRDLPRAEPALPLLTPDAPCILVSDVRLPGMSGLELLERVRQQAPDLPVILVTGHGDVGMAVNAMRAGAYDFIEKPYSPERLLDVVHRAIDQRRLTLENRRLRERLATLEGMDAVLLGHSPAIERVRHIVANLADTDADVLILGETGTGKELVAQSLHDGGRWRAGNFVAINCAALPESVFESEMFGAEPGAYTGATRRRIGKIEHAHRGTLFLDEIEGMPLPLQAKLLRVLQQRSVERLGANEAVPVQCRVVAASKEDLADASRDGRFRADLYYRLNVATLTLPPLRERREDIPLLFTHFLHQAARRFERPAPELSPALSDRLTAQHWPGNVRELKHAAERHVLGLWETDPPAGDDTLSLPLRVERFESALIESALAASRGGVTEAAAVLGIARKTLYDKLARNGIDPARFR